MPNSNRRGARPSAQPPPVQPPAMSITVSLSDIYGCLCPSCKTAFLDLLGEKATAQGLRDVFRHQLESPMPPPSGGGVSNPSP